jgi:DNA topoisomerase-1
VDVENNFKPIYEVGPDKKRTIADLKKYAKQAEKVWIATDEDRE